MVLRRARVDKFSVRSPLQREKKKQWVFALKKFHGKNEHPLPQSAQFVRIVTFGSTGG